MGAGNYYTSDMDQEKTFWIDLDFDTENMDEDEIQLQSEIQFDDVQYTIDTICKSKTFRTWHFDGDSMELENGLYIIKLESTYYGDGLVFNFQANEHHYNLAFANYSKAFDKWKRALIAAGLRLRMARSAWTSYQLELTK